MTGFIVSTDLDGTLLDHHDYSWEDAVAGLSLCREQGIPVILNTSKTASETLAIQAELGIKGPLIIENGSALILGSKQMTRLELIEPVRTTKLDDLQICLFGVSRSEILDLLGEYRTRHGWQFEGFNDWTVQTIAEQTGLSFEEAERAAKKHFTEPLIWQDSPSTLGDFQKALNEAGLKLLKGGRFSHVQGPCTKATPLDWLMQHAEALFGPTFSTEQVALCCLGDGQNDAAMLEAATLPVCVRSPVHSFPSLNTKQEIFYTKALGPAGWSEAITHIIGQNYHG